MEKTYIDEYGVTYSEDRATLLQGNAELEEYTVPTGTQRIADKAWKGMVKLRKIHLPEGISYIGMFAFAGCKGLGHVELPSTLQIICPYAFEFSGLTDIVLPHCLTDIFVGTFMHCANLRFVVVQDHLENINSMAFVGCHHLSLYIDAIEVTIKEMADDAFSSNPYNFDAYRLLVRDEMYAELAELFPYHKGKMQRMVKTNDPMVYKLYDSSNHDCGVFRFCKPE